jgi:hypothetical protein
MTKKIVKKNYVVENNIGKNGEIRLPARPLKNEIDAKAAVVALGVSTYKSAITALFVDSQVPLPMPYITWTPK